MDVCWPGISFAGQLLDWGRRQAEQSYPPHLARPIRTIGILGAGLTGSRIAQVAWLAGYRLLVVDPQREALERLAAIFPPLGLASQQPCPPHPPEDVLDKPLGEETYRWSAENLSTSACSRLILSQQVEPVEQCDLLLECVPENLLVKQHVLCQAESVLRPEALLATNTSTIPLRQLAGQLRNPERFCGIHFFMPIPYRPVVELVAGPGTGLATMATAAGFVRRLGLVPWSVEDGVGFLGNRLLFAWLNEALALWQEGWEPAQIDQQAKRFGWAEGPFALMDWIGLDVVVAGAWQLAEQWADRLVRSGGLLNLVKKGQLGRKTGRGFYRYDLEPAGESVLEGGMDDSCGGPMEAPISPNWDFRFQFRWGSAGEGVSATSLPEGPETQPSGTQEIPTQTPRGLPPGKSSCYSLPARQARLESQTDGTFQAEAELVRLHVAMLVEVEQMWREGRIQDPRQVDGVVVWGLGFPPQYGGLLAWTDRVGLPCLLTTVQALSKATFLLQPGYGWLWERAAAQKTYYPPHLWGQNQ